MKCCILSWEKKKFSFLYFEKIMLIFLSNQYFSGLGCACLLCSLQSLKSRTPNLSSHFSVCTLRRMTVSMEESGLSDNWDLGRRRRRVVTHGTGKLGGSEPRPSGGMFPGTELWLPPVPPQVFPGWMIRSSSTGTRVSPPWWSSTRSRPALP